MEITFEDLKNLLEEETDEYDILSLDMIEDMLGEYQTQEFLELSNIELDDNDEIFWYMILKLENLEELCDDDDFISLITAYFNLDEIIIIDE